VGNCEFAIKRTATLFSHWYTDKICALF